MPPAYELADPKHRWHRRASDDSDAEEKRIFAIAARLGDTMIKYIGEAEELLGRSAGEEVELANFIATWKNKFESELHIEPTEQGAANDEETVEVETEGEQ